MDLEALGLGLSLHSLLVNPALLCCLGFRGVISLEVFRPLQSRIQAVRHTSLPEWLREPKELFVCEGIRVIFSVRVQL